MYVAAVQHDPVKTGSSATGPIVLASVLGLVAGALIWLAVVVGRWAGEKRSTVGQQPARDVAPVG